MPDRDTKYNVFNIVSTSFQYHFNPPVSTNAVLFHSAVSVWSTSRCPVGGGECVCVWSEDEARAGEVAGPNRVQRTSSRRQRMRKVNGDWGNVPGLLRCAVSTLGPIL